MARLPQPGGDNGTWGNVLNDYLSQTLKGDGTLKDNSVTSSALAPNSVTNSAIASDAVNATSIADGSITEPLLATAVQTKLNATGDWNTLSNKPAVVGAGADQAAARTAISAQAADADLTAFAALTSAANKVPYATGAGTWALTDFTATGRASAGAADAAAARTAIAAQMALAETAVKTSAYTAAPGDLIPADASGGPFTITLPSAPDDKSIILAKKLDSSINVVTVQRGGTDVFNVTGGATSLQLTLQDQTVSLQYKASAGIWYVTGHGTPVAGLKAYYDAVASTLTTKSVDLGSNTGLDPG